ncbi:hypothetical protein [Nitrosopumilus sp.]|uniref:hypothetical protein n=1 Tax=Nitrosopumilus sp. TaxID=2024843 RepID=UPI003D0F8758
MKARLLTIIVGMIIVSSIIFVAIWYSIPEECDEECEIERRILAGISGTRTFDPFERPSEIKPEFPPIKEEHYSIEITGMKDIYRLGEQYDFSYIISGYGYSCGSKTVSFPDQTGEMIGIHSFGLCEPETMMKEFVFDVRKEQGTTFGHIALQNSGTYNVTVTFDKPSEDSPTTVTKEFRVPPPNSWYNNQLSDVDLQTVMDSCANDSSKERMTNTLRYTNGTHVFLNLGCEWQTIGKFVGEIENEE